MLAGKECFEVGINFFRKITVNKVEITTKNRVFLFKYERDPLDAYLNPDDPDFQRYLQASFEQTYISVDPIFIRPILSALTLSNIDTISLKSLNENCIPFLQQFESKISAVSLKVC